MSKRQAKSEAADEGVKQVKTTGLQAAGCSNQDSSSSYWKQQLIKKYTKLETNAEGVKQDKTTPPVAVGCDGSSKNSTTSACWKQNLTMQRNHSAVLSETPVTCFREIWGAPKKRVSHLCRIQTPPPEDLHKEWPLEDGGSWGYAFNYSASEACLYQVEKGESYNPAGLKATLTSTDWSVLVVLGSSALKPTLPQNDKKGEGNRIASSMVWETKSSPSGRWYFRASHQVCTVAEKTTDNFVLEYFNNECGVFQLALRLPLEDWLKAMKETAEKICHLFAASQTYKDIMLTRDFTTTTTTVAVDSSDLKMAPQAGLLPSPPPLPPLPSPPPTPPPPPPPPSPPPASPAASPPQRPPRPTRPATLPLESQSAVSPQRRVSSPFPKCSKKLFRSLSAPAILTHRSSSPPRTVQEENEPGSSAESPPPPPRAPTPGPIGTPSTASSPPTTPEFEDDETDGRLSIILMNTVKSVVVYLLEHVLGLYREEICEGCAISHPSQNQHPCLEEDPDYFYMLNFNEVNKRLWKPTFIPAISSALEKRGLYVSTSRIRGIVEAFLYDLKFATHIREKTTKVFNTLVGDSVPKHEMIKQAFKIWENQPAF